MITNIRDSVQTIFCPIQVQDGRPGLSRFGGDISGYTYVTPVGPILIIFGEKWYLYYGIYPTLYEHNTILGQSKIQNGHPTI